ncbi:PH domain-containing protein [Arthrobacter sp. ISL-48]|uniref:PH domain-containing protein n=1 Tax=Arthrobacter sp. ISL-48 TaxID=2819110 RepID=UPI001BE859C2|nr:PH domain-containing protein [Arthrobacter sp. ISL-48]MBT2530733.1 PH domain-containing protein [Arthrobacter sp. ISL-48]
MRKDLAPGEQVIVTTRPQPRKLVGAALAFVAAPAAAAFTSAWIIRGEAARLVPAVSTAWSPWLVTGCVLAAAWIWLAYCLPRLLRWQGTRYTLTSHRIVARYGMLRRRDQQVNLAAVRGVTVHQSVLQRILRSGNISLETGYQAVVTLQDVPEAVRFRGFVLDAIDELPEHAEPGTDDMSDYTDEAFPWELREGGRDER